ncbi:MAG TPA: hypothetical protein VFY89_09400 [Ktedonobacterales bacterium]
MQERHPESGQDRPSSPPGNHDSSHYTGVVLIHGLGDIKRNHMLQQALNSLMYWLNHEAGFALRAEGPGRVWLTTELTDATDPDAPAARATMELTPPDSPRPASASNPPLRLEFREVWWAESFGMPSISTTIKWARVQFREEAAHLLLPIGRRIGPAHTAARAPAREIPQALTFRASPAARNAPAAPEEAEHHPVLTRTRRAVLRAALGLYSGMQYVWKAVQWLILTPLIMLLLLVIGLARVLAVIPFLQSAVITSFTAFSNYVMLHWIASMQVYLLDYTRSSAVRQRFESEVEALLQDEHCDRVIVIAESMGTVIAYEGLTTALARPAAHNAPKPVTFICVAAALRRIWLLANADPHRIHGVLPEHVRWLHFWARYDPIAAGPLTADSLPPLENWPDRDTPKPVTAIRASLARCENVDVVNSDSTLSDHTGYWDNLEQVVGPIASELVAGHPALEEAVWQHLATPDDILWRRWQVAWRATVSLLGGLAVGVAILVLDLIGKVPAGQWVRDHLAAISLHDVVASVCQPCANLIPTTLPQSNPQDFFHTLPQIGLIFPYLFLYLNTGTLFTLAAALVVATLGTLSIGRLVALEPPFSFRASSPIAPGRLNSMLALAMLAVSLVAAATFVEANYVFTFSQPAANYQTVQSLQAVFIWLVGSSQLIGITALLIGIVHAAQNRRWGWFVAIPLATIAANADLFQPPSGVPPFSIVFVAVALAGCLFGIADAVRGQRWAWLVALLSFTGLLVFGSLGRLVLLYAPQLSATVSPLIGIGGYNEPGLPILIYGLWSGPLFARARRGAESKLDTLFTLVVSATLLLATYFMLQLLRTGLLVSYVSSVETTDNLLRTLAVGAVTLGALAFIPALYDAVRGRRWNWLTVLLVGAVALLGVVAANPPLYLLGLATLATIYGLWSGPRQAAPGAKGDAA